MDTIAGLLPRIPLPRIMLPRIPFPRIPLPRIPLPRILLTQISPVAMVTMLLLCVVLGELVGGDGGKVHSARRGSRSGKTRRDSEPGTTTSKSFAGKMQQFMFNDKPLFDMVRTGSSQNVNTNVEYSTDNEEIQDPFTFRTTAAYLTTTLRLYGKFTIYLKLKTTQPNGLILYSGAGNPDKDFLALELVDGKLNYVFNVGSGPRVVKANLRQDLNDNKWHQIAVVRNTLTTHMLRVDDSIAYDNLPEVSSVHFDTDSEFYIGGVERAMYGSLPDKVKSREGFQGCVGSLDIDGDSRNILEKHRSNIPQEYQKDIEVGCEGPQTVCDVTSCQNRGICRQQWDAYTCDCHLTSFTGARCQDDSISYTFGSSGGLIHFAFAENDIHNSKQDQLALGFITDQKDAILTRIDSRDSEDFIEMELVDGKILVMYNMGTMDHPIGQFFNTVDDGAYHVVRFIRNGANSSIELDDLEPQFKHPSGSQTSIFNGLGDIYIGGRKDHEGRIVKPFTGTISGYMLNSDPILERASEGDPRVTIEGDIQIDLIQPIHGHAGLTDEPATSPVIVTPLPGDLSTPGMQSTMGAKTTPKGAGTSDDIVFVNPDCEEIDNSDCPDVDPNALINPRVTFRPTPEPTSTASTLEGGDPDEPCDPDDEDCLTGSGSGFTVEPAISTPNTGDTNHDLDQDKDIDIDQDKDKEVVPPGKPSPDTPIIIDVNMTETPLHHAVMPSTPTPHGGQEGGVNRDNQDSSGSDGKSQQGSSTLGMNIGLIVGIALGVVLLLLIVAFAFYKYKSRDEGSYKMDESKNYSYETCNTKPPPPHTNGGLSKSASNCSKSKKRDVKEWYV